LAARQLQRDFAVTVLEAGNEFRPLRADPRRLAQFRRTGLFRDERMIRLLFPAMRVTLTSEHMALVRGMATGGTTTLATGNALRCDEGLRELGIDLDSEFAALSRELPISTAHQKRWRPVTRTLFETCGRLNLAPEVMPKLVDNQRCTRCGRCVLGCPTGAKWDSRRHLREAVAAGARLVTGARVESILGFRQGAAGRATGVVAHMHGRRRFLPADLVVLAAGGLGTPAILERSRIPTQPRLFVDPVLCVSAPYPDAHLDREVPMPFVAQRDGYLLSPYFDYLSFFFNRTWRLPAPGIITLMVKLMDTETGSVTAAGRRGRVDICKALTRRDRDRFVEATSLCRDILAECGVNPSAAFLGTLNAGHPGGTVPLTGRERHELHPDALPDNVYVADASLLPVSLGRPPMMTIMALAHRIATVCRDRLA
jgi:ferredoxin